MKAEAVLGLPPCDSRTHTHAASSMYNMLVVTSVKKLRRPALSILDPISMLYIFQRLQ